MTTFKCPKALYAIVAISFSLFSVGCTTLADVKAAKGKGEGEVAVYASGFDDVWRASIAYIEESKLDLVAEDKDNGTILAERSANVANYGDNLAVFVDAESSAKTRVEAVHKRAVQTNIFGALWDKRVIQHLDEKFERQH